MTKKDEPYRPRYKGFDEETTRNAQATAQRAQEGAAAKGEHVDAAYLDDGPEEAARRMGSDAKSVGDAIERARKKRQ